MKNIRCKAKTGSGTDLRSSRDSCAQTEHPHTLKHKQHPYNATRPPNAEKSAHPALISRSILSVAADHGVSGKMGRNTAPTVRKKSTHPQTFKLLLTAFPMARDNPAFLEKPERFSRGCLSPLTDDRNGTQSAVLSKLATICNPYNNTPRRTFCSKAHLHNQ